MTVCSLEVLGVPWGSLVLLGVPWSYLGSLGVPCGSLVSLGFLAPWCPLGLLAPRYPRYTGGRQRSPVALSDVKEPQRAPCNRKEPQLALRHPTEPQRNPKEPHATQRNPTKSVGTPREPTRLHRTQKDINGHPPASTGPKEPARGRAVPREAAPREAQLQATY